MKKKKKTGRWKEKKLGRERDKPAECDSPLSVQEEPAAKKASKRCVPSRGFLTLESQDSGSEWVGKERSRWGLPFPTGSTATTTLTCSLSMDATTRSIFDETQRNNDDS